MVPGFTARRVMIVAALFIVGYFGVSAVSNAVTHVRLVREQADVQREIDVLQQRQARLQALKTYMESDAFIEAGARESGLVKPGEVAVVRVGGGVSEPPVKPGEPWWTRYFNDALSSPEPRR